MRRSIIYTSLSMSVIFVIPILFYAFWDDSGRNFETSYNYGIMAEIIFSCFFFMLIPNTLFGFALLIYVQAKKQYSIYPFVICGVIVSALLNIIPAWAMANAHNKHESEIKVYLELLPFVCAFGVINCIILWWFSVKRKLL